MLNTKNQPLGRARLAGWLGLLLLSVSMIGAWASTGLGWSAGSPTATADTVVAAPEKPTNSAARGVAFGFVDVETGVTCLYPTQPGKIVEVLTREGSAVAKDAPLYRVDDRAARLLLDAAKVAVGAAETRVTQARALAAQHRAQLTALEAAVEAAKHKAEAARGLRDKAARFYDGKLGGSEEDVKAASASVKEAEANVKAQESQLAALTALDPQNTLTLAEHDLAAKKIDLQRAEFVVRECTVFAPAKGQVLRLDARVGDLVAPPVGPGAKQPLIFCPEGPRVVRAEVEQEFAGRVAIGQSASIQDDASANSNWTGKVIRVSDWYTHRRSILQEPLQFNDVRTLECVIELTPGQAPLKIGQRMRVLLGGLGS